MKVSTSKPAFEKRQNVGGKFAEPSVNEIFKIENMKIKSKIYLILLLLFVIQINEIHAQKRKKRNSTLESVNFDKKKNVTTYIIFPFGTVTLKGKWEEVKINNVSKQKTFRNADSIEMLVCLNDCKNYEFNSDRKATNENFIDRFYTWEKEYFEQNHNLKVAILENNKTNNYLIYNIKGKIKDDEIDTILFIAEKNCNVKTLSMHKTNLMTTEDRVKLIKDTFNNE